MNPWMGGWTPGETVRTVELPALGEVKEGELGSLVVGDWLMLISPVMKDLTVSSGAWWDQVLAVAAEAYAQWLPLQRLHIRPRAVEDEGGRWSRVAQRAQAMLVAALPPGLKAEVLAERAATAWGILFRVFTRYQPGGLAERSQLLRGLVEPRMPTTLSEVVDGVRTWKRWLARTRELKVAIPDATLLVGALDRFVGMVTKHSGQAMFRLNAARAGLRVDVAPSLEAVAQLADVVLAEGEAALHGASTSSTTTAKVKALVTKGGGGWEKGKDSPKGGGKGKGKDASAAPVCRFFLTDGGCKKGADCTYKHEFDGDKRGRCWNCGGTSHTRKDCPVKVRKPRDGDGGAKNFSENDVKGQAVKKVEVDASAPTTGGGEGSPASGAGKTSQSDGSDGEAVRGLIQEAAGLLKSLRGPELRRIQVSSLEVKNKRALLDGGATHSLRQCVSAQEWEEAREVEVHLAQGTVSLRLIPWTRTLLTTEEVQPIVPLGYLVQRGYSVKWEEDRFQLTDQHGRTLDTALEGGCPTVDEGLGLELIKELELEALKHQMRLMALRGKPLTTQEEEKVGLEMVKWLRRLRELFPEVPERILERLPPRSEWTSLPWNIRARTRSSGRRSWRQQTEWCFALIWSWEKARMLGRTA